MKILLVCCIQAKSLSHASLVIINWLTLVKLRTEFLLRHVLEHWCTRGD